MADPAQLQALLRSFPFLSDQPDELIALLASRAQLVRYAFGQPIARTDRSTGQVFFLLQGTVRSVVMADRFPRKVATLQRHEVGAVLAWSALSSDRNWETLLASTNTVLLAVPHDTFQEGMQRHPGLASRVRGSVNPAELFAVLDRYLSDYPRLLTDELIHAAVELADSTPSVTVTQASLAGLPRDPNRLWLVAGGPLALGQLIRGDEQLEGDPNTPVRLLALDNLALQSILLPPPPPAAGDAADPQTQPDWQRQLLQAWQAQEASFDPEAIPPGQALVEVEIPEETSDNKPPSAFPYHRGDKPADSAIAAFRMLCDHLNLPFRRELFRRVFSDHAARHEGMSLALCGAVAESIGLQTQLLTLKAEGIPRLETPLMVRWGHGVAVIYRVSATSLVLGVPAGGGGNRELSLQAFTELWATEGQEEGEVLTIAANTLTPTRKFGFSWFLPAIRRHRTLLIEVLLASFFAQLFGLANPLLIQQVIDKAIINASPDALGLLGSMLVLFALFEGLLLTLRTFLFVDTTNRIDLSLGTAVIDHLLRLPISYFDRRPVGEVSSRIAELEKVRGFLTGTALTTILDASFALLYLVVMLIYSWQLTLLTLAVIPVLVVLVLFVSPIIRQQIQQRAVANARTQSHLVEVLNSMMTVKAQNIELRTRWRWQELYTDFVAEGFDNTLTSTVAGNVSGFLNTLSSLLVIWGGAYLVLNGDLTLGELIAFRIISGNVTGPLLRMSSIWQSVQEVSLSLERLSDVIDTPQEAGEDNYRRMVMPAIKGGIEFQNVEFRYKPSSPLQLEGVNLQIPAGSFVALVGTSGSGKSTLTKLVARLYAPESGRVLVDGIDIAKVELYSLRRQLGIVPQDTVLFDGSVEENIALTNPDATTEEIIQAATIAAAHDFIMDLPAGYATQVGERGSGLSGGQRQRIAIARTILQRPNMLIMDEATSALDYQTERVVSENLMEALRGSTVLFITHRLSSITNADLIICMGQGTVLETGSHAELMAANGPYSVLFRQQGRSGGSSSSSSSGSSSSSSRPRSRTPVMRSPSGAIGPR